MFARVTQLVLILALQQCVHSFDRMQPARHNKTDSTNVVFVILSQSEPYHASVAKRLKDNIESQVFQVEERYPIVHVTHEDFHIPGDWTIIPLLEPLYMKYIFGDIRWFMFIEAHTTVRCNQLFDALAKADLEVDSLWLGYPISDAEPTIIHHFQQYEELEEEGGFVYPNLPSGIAMRLDLMKMLVEQLRSKLVKTMEFSIDAGYELAQLVHAGEGPLVTAEMSFCLIAADNCAVYPTHHNICGSSIPEDSIFFAVKTWNGYHDTRVRVVKKTWGKHVTNLLFYSNVDDPKLPSVKMRVPNVKTGHCAKTMAILRDVVKRVEGKPHIKWIFLADDDTVLGVQRLCEILTCYRGGGEVTVLGERYGYGYSFQQKENGGNAGYDYISGGGGTVLSVGAARLLSTCACATVAAPDDMTLGACAMHKLGISLTHSPLFHQARPQDYPREVLTLDRPVSFHRHSSPDPLKVYATWFQHDDLALKKRDEL